MRQLRIEHCTAVMGSRRICTDEKRTKVDRAAKDAHADLRRLYRVQKAGKERVPKRAPRCSGKSKDGVPRRVEKVQNGGASAYSRATESNKEPRGVVEKGESGDRPGGQGADTIADFWRPDLIHTAAESRGIQPNFLLKQSESPYWRPSIYASESPTWPLPKTLFDNRARGTARTRGSRDSEGDGT